MRKLVLLAAALVALAAAAPASAHNDFVAYNFFGDQVGCSFAPGWSCTINDGDAPPPGFVNLDSCGEQLTLLAGETRYVLNGTPPNGGNRDPQELSFGVFVVDSAGGWHIHRGDVAIEITGNETRRFLLNQSAPTSLRATVSTRRVESIVRAPNPDWHLRTVKLVHSEGSNPIIVRADC